VQTAGVPEIPLVPEARLPAQVAPALLNMASGKEADAPTVVSPMKILRRTARENLHFN